MRGFDAWCDELLYEIQYIYGKLEGAGTCSMAWKHGPDQVDESLDVDK